MLLRWPGVEITGITTVGDPGGLRAGYVRTVLRFFGRDDIPVAAGAAVSSTTGLPMGAVADEKRYWGSPARPAPSPPGAAVRLLDRSIEQGATTVAIGPYTNLADLERAAPGRLRATRLVAMGGWTGALDPDLPNWGAERDWNVQCDTSAARVVLQRADVTWVPIAVTARTGLRVRDLPRLAGGGPLGELLARQAQAWAVDRAIADLARCTPGLPDDLLNFHHDPLACAVALDWPGVQVESVELRPVADNGVLRFVRRPDGRRCRLATAVAGPAFGQVWLDRVVEAGSC